MHTLFVDGQHLNGRGLMIHLKESSGQNKASFARSISEVFKFHLLTINIGFAIENEQSIAMQNQEHY